MRPSSLADLRGADRRTRRSKRPTRSGSRLNPATRLRLLGLSVLTRAAPPIPSRRGKRRPQPAAESPSSFSAQQRQVAFLVTADHLQVIPRCKWRKLGWILEACHHPGEHRKLAFQMMGNQRIRSLQPVAILEREAWGNIREIAEPRLVRKVAPDSGVPGIDRFAGRKQPRARMVQMKIAGASDSQDGQERHPQLEVPRFTWSH